MLGSGLICENNIAENENGGSQSQEWFVHDHLRVGVRIQYTLSCRAEVRWAHSFSVEDPAHIGEHDSVSPKHQHPLRPSGVWGTFSEFVVRLNRREGERNHDGSEELRNLVCNGKSALVWTKNSGPSSGALKDNRRI